MKKQVNQSKKSFKSTPIPYRTKSDDPMAYYSLSDDGEIHTAVTRAECLSRTVEPKNSFPQRWLVDEESGLVIRLPRNQMGEDLARDNMRYIWSEDKKQERKFSCIAKGSKRCPITCSKCPMNDICESKHKAKNGLLCVKKCESCSLIQTREIELDKTYITDNGDSIPCFEPVDPTDLTEIVEQKAILDTLYKALAALAPKDRDLIKDIYWDNKTERELAPLLGYKQSKSVNKRKHKILETLRQNEALKSFFE